MTALNNGSDRFIRSVDVVDGSAESLYIAEDQDRDGAYETGSAVTVTAGEYWGHHDSAFDSTLPGLYRAYASALNNDGSLSNSYAFRAHTPPGSTVTNSGIKLVATNGDPDPFQIQWGTGDVPPWWFGWAEDETGHANSTSGEIRSPYSAMTYWQPWPLFDARRASEKEWGEEAMHFVSHDDEKHSLQTQHGETTETRRFRYEWLAAGHVRDGKALDSTHADNAGLPTGDVHNAYYHLWNRARRKHEVIVVHNDGDQDLLVDSHSWERGYLTPPSARNSFKPALEVARDGGEFYQLELKLVLLGGNVDIR